jgi:hypothetical protein
MPAETSSDPGLMSGSETAATTDKDTNALLSRLRVIEDQPLESRAAAFVQIHDRLQATLEGSLRDSGLHGGVDASLTHG